MAIDVLKYDSDREYLVIGANAFLGIFDLSNSEIDKEY